MDELEAAINLSPLRTIIFYLAVTKAPQGANDVPSSHRLEDVLKKFAKTGLLWEDLKFLRNQNLLIASDESWAFEPVGPSSTTILAHLHAIAQETSGLQQQQRNDRWKIDRNGLIDKPSSALGLIAFKEMFVLRGSEAVPTEIFSTFLISTKIKNGDEIERFLRTMKELNFIRASDFSDSRLEPHTCLYTQEMFLELLAMDQLQRANSADRHDLRLNLRETVSKFVTKAEATRAS